MPIKSDPVAFEQPWRRNYEKYCALGWASPAVGYGIYGFFGNMPSMPSYVIAGLSLAMAAYRMPGAVKLERLQSKLSGRDLTIMTVPELKAKAVSPQHMKEFWLGRGFVWTHTHTQRLYAMMDKDWSNVAKQSKETPVDDVVHWGREVVDSSKDVFLKSGSVGEYSIADMGQKWIHGVEAVETDLYQPIDHVAGHTLIVGTTGAGKTRCFDLLISQAIAKGECVIIIDPKGDAEMRDNARAACEEVGRIGDFEMFHPAFPEESTPINPLANFSDISDIPSRISALLAGGGSSESFKQFGWLAMNQICQALYFLEKRPTLRSILQSLQMGGDDLLEQCVTKYGIEKLGEQTFRDYFDATNPLNEEGKPVDRFWTPTKGYCMVYKIYLQADYPNPAIEGLISLCEHDKAHFGKMIASLIPILSMLTSGKLGDMLSPPETTVRNLADLSNAKPFRDMRWFLEKKKVVYIGLNSLANSVVGSALGSIILSDLTSVAGNRYNFETKKVPISIFVDETSEVVNEPLIQLLNKGRGAGFKVFVATQLIADFAARLGSKDKASQLLGNLNNVIALRTIEPETQEFLTEKMPTTRVHHVEHSQNSSISADSPHEHSGSLSERLAVEEVPLFPPQLFGCLPSLEYIAILSGGTVLKGRIPLLVRANEN